MERVWGLKSVFLVHTRTSLGDRGGHAPLWGVSKEGKLWRF